MRFSVPLYAKMIKKLYSGICRTTLQLICSPRHVSLPQKSAGFSVTMTVFALETPFWGHRHRKNALVLRDGARKTAQVPANLQEATVILRKSLPISRMLPPISGKLPSASKNPAQSLQFSKPLDKFVAINRKTHYEIFSFATIPSAMEST